MTAEDGGEMFATVVESTIKEVGNIIGGAYLTALTSLTGINLIPSATIVSTGTVKSTIFELMSVPHHTTEISVITGLEKGQPLIMGEFVLIPEPESIAPLLSVFGL